MGNGNQRKRQKLKEHGPILTPSGPARRCTRTGFQRCGEGSTKESKALVRTSAGPRALGRAQPENSRLMPRRDDFCLSIDAPQSTTIAPFQKPRQGRTAKTRDTGKAIKLPESRAPPAQENKTLHTGYLKTFWKDFVEVRPAPGAHETLRKCDGFAPRPGFRGRPDLKRFTDKS